MSTVSRAADLAEKYHKGQMYGTEPYFSGHICPVATFVAMDDRCTHTHLMVAYLHDILEDTEATESDLREEGFSPEVIKSVLEITRSPAESYFDYIKRVKKDEVARVVKIHDLTFNLTKSPPESLRGRYKKALSILLGQLS